MTDRLMRDIEDSEKANLAQQAAGSNLDKPITGRDLLTAAKEIAQSVQEQMNYANRRIYNLECQLAKYERIFEAAFKDELDRRMRGDKSSQAEAGCAIESMESRIQRTLGNAVLGGGHISGLGSR